MSVGTRARDPVDELEALSLETGEFGFDVVGAVREVVESLTATFEEATDGRLRAQWLEEFDSADEGDADSLGLQRFRRGTGFPEQNLEEAARLFQRSNGDAYVVQWAAGL